MGHLTKKNDPSPEATERNSSCIHEYETTADRKHEMIKSHFFMADMKIA